MALQLIDLSLASPQEHLALAEALLLEAESAAAEGRKLGYLRFWESPKHFVVLGVSCGLAAAAERGGRGGERDARRRRDDGDAVGVSDPSAAA